MNLLPKRVALHPSLASLRAPALPLGSTGRPLLFLLAVLWLATAPVALAQPVFEFTQELDFDEPEAWAMKTFTTLSTTSALGPVEEGERGRIDLGLEVLQVPHFDTEQRTVGFGGFKEEDLNRSPVWGRLRADFGLGAGFTLTLGWAPPVEVDGVEANLISVSLARRLYTGRRWQLGARLHAQGGEADGDFTCAEGGDLRFTPGSPGNPFGCEAPSRDTMTMDAYGASLVASFSGGGKGPRWHFEAGWNQLDMEFQVDALTFGIRDRTLLLADGDVTHLAAGATWDLGAATRLGVEVFYAPLDVQRSGDLSPRSDDLLNFRVLGRYRLR